MSNAIDGVKVCSKCRESKPVAAFFTNARSGDGYQAYCRACTKAANDAARDYRRARLQDPVRRERNRSLCAARHAAKRDEHRAKDRARYAAHPEKWKAWRQRNADRYRLYSRQYGRMRNARKRGSQYTRVDYAAIAERDGMRCHICHRKVASASLSFDHLIPVSKGGPHVEWNIAVAHLRCNMRRGAGRFAAQFKLPL